MPLSRLSAALGAAILTLTLGACGDDTSGGGDAGTASSSGAATTQAGSLSMTDPWVKAAETGMTAAFGTLVNSGTSDITVTSATSSITSAMELHETVENADGTMAMQPKAGGFLIPAGGDHELAPGGDHLMIMDLNAPLEPGEKVTITLELEDGSTIEIEAIVKEFSGADEEYQDDGDMDMGSSEDSSGDM